MSDDIPRTALWQKRRRDEIRSAAAAGAVALLPIGAIEQHGPHLPLDTDSFTAFTVCTRAAASIRDFPVLVLPPIWWGLSPHWMTFPGTLTVKPDTLVALVVDICESAGRHGVRHVIIVNGHAGNNGIIQTAALQVAQRGVHVAALSYWNAIPDVMSAVTDHDAGGIGHSGEVETSIQLHLQPECVDMSTISPEQCLDLTARAARHGSIGGVYIPPDPAAESPHGVYGMANAGSAEKGERVIDAAVSRLAELVRHFRDHDAHRPR
jgi:creatinine amidohydrolase